MMSVLLVIQISFALAIICNMLHLVGDELRPLLVNTGIDDKCLVVVDGLFSSDGMWDAPDIGAGENSLASIPGVRGLSAIFGLPLLQSSKMQLSLESQQGKIIKTQVYLGNNLINTLGLRLTSGRNFLRSDYLKFGIGPGATNSVRSSSIQPIIITDALARSYFGTSPALGSLLIDSDYPEGKFIVIGTIKHLISDMSSTSSDDLNDNSILLPYQIGKTMFFSLAIRTSDPPNAVLLGKIKKRLVLALGPRLNRSNMSVSSYLNLREKTFSSQTSAVWLLGAVTLVIMVMTMVSVLGFTVFWIQRRTKHIGIRRALGARKVDIIVLFLVENMIMIAAAVPLGMVFAISGSFFLIKNYEVSALPLYYLPVSCLIVFILGQLAVAIPAFRAAAVPPAVAVRSSGRRFNSVI